MGSPLLAGLASSFQSALKSVLRVGSGDMFQII